MMTSRSLQLPAAAGRWRRLAGGGEDEAEAQILLYESGGQVPLPLPRPPPPPLCLAAFVLAVHY
jgi:hypothetical protein